MERTVDDELDLDDDQPAGDGMPRSHSFTCTDIQRIKLNKLMQNIDKPVDIPTRLTAKKFVAAPEFVRNVMGSSAGAGSGEFHVYRHLRRKEFARLKGIEQQAKNEQLDADYHRKLEESRLDLEERTAKKRLKRQKRKDKLKKRAKRKTDGQTKDGKSSRESDDDETESENETD